MPKRNKPAAYRDDMEFYTQEQYDSFDDDLKEDLIPLYESEGKAMRCYELGWRLETIQYKIENVAHVVDLIASDIADNTHSGAVWSVYDTLKSIAAEIDNLVGEAYLEDVPEKKPIAKKKKK